MATRLFDPIVLDLTNDDDYAVLVEALEGYASQLEHDAEENAADEAQALFFRQSATRARNMVARVHEQLDLNAALRREG